jgi:hypothetical protein
LRKKCLTDGSGEDLWYFPPYKRSLPVPSVYLLFSELQKCVPEQQISTDERYVFLRRPWYENDSLIHVLCASSQLWGLHGGAVLVDHSGHSPLTLTHLIHEYHDDIPWNSVPTRGLRGATFVAKY